MENSKPDKGVVGWFRSHWQRYQDAKRREEDILRSVDMVVDIADPDIRKAKGYRKQIYDSIDTVKLYCSSVIENIPGPVRMDRKHYFDDPTVTALFVSAENMEEIIHISPEVKAFKETGYTGEVTALLTMTMEQKTVFGQQQHGDIILRDVAQKAVNFVDHRLIAPSPDLAAAKHGIADHGLVVLATFAMEKITNLRARIGALREKREYLKGAIKILDQKSVAQYRYTVPSPAMQEELVKAKDGLEKVERELEETRKKLSGPEDSLQYLLEMINHPEGAIQMKPQRLRLNWMNVKIREEKSEGNDIVLTEICFPEDVKRSAIYVTFTI